MSNNTCDPAGKKKNEHLYHAAKTVLNRRGYDNDIPSLIDLPVGRSHNDGHPLQRAKDIENSSQTLALAAFATWKTRLRRGHAGIRPSFGRPSGL